MSVSSLDKDPPFPAGEHKWDALSVGVGVGGGAGGGVGAAPDVLPRASLPHAKSTQPTRPRPQSFAQKLRSTGKSVKGKLGTYIYESSQFLF